MNDVIRVVMLHVVSRRGVIVPYADPTLFFQTDIIISCFLHSSF